jgi:ATP-dependent Clp protease ATP-binding subunit ClpA
VAKPEFDPILRSVHEAVELGHQWVGVEHLLLALTRPNNERPTLAQKVLAESGVTPESVLSVLSQVQMPIDPSNSSRGPTSRLILVRGRAEGLAIAAGVRNPSDEQFLIALLWEAQGIHALVFERSNVNPRDIQRKLRDHGVAVWDA